MNTEIKQKILKVCNEKIEKKGNNVGLSFYAFFENKNTNPELLMTVAKWWIETEKLDHFEKAMKIRDIVIKMK
jgi:mannitol-1-phosphate/altronate dehydrogenase